MAVVIHESNVTINVGSNADYVVYGNDDLILMGDDSTFVGCGSAIFVNVYGTGDVVTIGGNGAGAASSLVNVVLLRQGGTVHQLANSSVEVIADNSKVTMAGDDTLTVTGSGDNVYATGVGNALSIGQNGSNATGAARDNVRGLKNSTLSLFQNSSVWSYGTGYTATMNGQDTLTAIGFAVTVNATGDDNALTIGANGQTPGVDDDIVHMDGGVISVLRDSNVQIFGNGLLVRANGDDTMTMTGDDDSFVGRGLALLLDVYGSNNSVNIGGNGAGADASQLDVVTLHDAATLREIANSSVYVTADNSKLTMVGNDKLTVVGSGDTVYATGLDDAVWIGGNGVGATGAALDSVLGLENGTLALFQNSSVWAHGSGYSATMTGDDTLTATGLGVNVTATGDNNTLTIGGNDQTPGEEEVVLMNNGVIKVLKNSSAQVFGDHLVVRALGGDALNVIGDADRVALGSFGNSITIGQNGAPITAPDVVTFSYTPLTTQVTVLQESSVRVVGSNANVTLGGHDQLTLIGYQEQIVDQTGNNHITIGGNGSVFFQQFNNYVTLAPGDVVTMLANSNLTLFSDPSSANGEYAVHMAAKTALSVDTGMTVYVPVAVGDDLLLNFGPTDILQLASHYSSVDDLLAHTSQDFMGRAVVSLDTANDTLTLGMDKATFAGYAQQGLVKFS